jgi:hypothetical protein
MTVKPWLKSSPCLSSPLCIIETIISMAKFAMSAAVVMAIFCSHLFGQSGAASIQGKVTDSTGAAVVGASVSILHQETGLAIEAYRNVSRNYPFTVGYGENYEGVQYTSSNNYLLISAPKSSSSYCWPEGLLDWPDTAPPLTWHD